MPNFHLLRHTIEDLFAKGQHRSAAALAERLSAASGRVSDCILFAKCYRAGEEKRRCLVVLEQKGLLSAAAVVEVGKWLSGSELDDGISDRTDQLQAVVLGGQCLYDLGQYEDCVSLLQPLIMVSDDESSAAEVTRLVSTRHSAPGTPTVNVLSLVASLYVLAGKCYDLLEHRTRARRALVGCARLDPACVEAVEYLVEHGLLTATQKAALFAELSKTCPVKEVLEMHTLALSQSSAAAAELGLSAPGCASWTARCAEACFERNRVDDAYRLSRQAYAIDPYNISGLAVYIACLASLQLKSELFYLGHELVSSAPRSALSWYAVGCYYWICGKYELAQKNLLKATKLDKRQARAWVMLGHVLSAQEESEQAISAYRTASRLLPEDCRPMALIAKELAKSNHLAPALHMLSAALDLSPEEPGLLNDMAVTYMRQGSMDLALRFFERAVYALDASLGGVDGASAEPEGLYPSSIQSTPSSSRGSEVFSNYATALRKCGRHEEALHWYDKAMSANPNDGNCHAAVGFTFHLMQRFDMAISSYHQALSLDPGLTFCADMLNRAMEDSSDYPTIRADDADEDAAKYGGFTRLSNYYLGGDPVASGELESHAEEANKSFGAGADTTALSAFPSEMQSPGVSLADSYSQIEGRLSVTGTRWESGGVLGMNNATIQEGSFMSQGSFVSDNGGYLDDSFN